MIQDKDKIGEPADISDDDLDSVQGGATFGNRIGSAETTWNFSSGADDAEENPFPIASSSGGAAL